MGRSMYVVVHPEATRHVDGVVGGWHDSDLTAQGQRHAQGIARVLGHQLAGLDVEVYSSDLLRAQRTGHAIASRFNRTPILDLRLREKSYGIAEGRPQSWLDERFIPPPAMGDRMSHDEGIPGAEAKSDFAERIYAAVDEILTCSAEHVVVVTHGFALTYVITAWLQLPRSDIGYTSFAAKPGSITTPPRRRLLPQQASRHPRRHESPRLKVLCPWPSSSGANA